MAIGIVAFAYVGIIALLPAGMSNFGKALDNSLGSQITLRLATEAQQTDFDALTANNQPTLRYFDYQGNELPAISGSVYTAEITVVTPTALPNTSTPPSASLATVTIRLANNPGENPLPFAPAARLRIRTHTALVARK